MPPVPLVPKKKVHDPPPPPVTVGGTASHGGGAMGLLLPPQRWNPRGLCCPSPHFSPGPEWAMVIRGGHKGWS